jgi:NADH pyrophosphatase NudC (nudix superfamily)
MRQITETLEQAREREVREAVRRECPELRQQTADSYALQLITIAQQYELAHEWIQAWLSHRAELKDWSLGAFESWCKEVKVIRERAAEALSMSRTARVTFCNDCGKVVMTLRCGEAMVCMSCGASNPLRCA